MYRAGFRVIIPEAIEEWPYDGRRRDFDQTIQCGDDAFLTTEAATTFAQKNANSYLNLLAVFGIIDPEDIANTFFEQISPN
jgi:hypothetical protein